MKRPRATCFAWILTALAAAGAGVWVTTRMRGPTESSASQITVHAAGPAGGHAPTIMVAGDSLEAVLRTSIASRLLKDAGFDATRAEELATCAAEYLASIAAADVARALAVVQRAGGDFRSDQLRLIREHWRGAPAGIAPPDWRSLNDLQVAARLYGRAQPWSAVYLRDTAARLIDSPSGFVDAASSPSLASDTQRAALPLFEIPALDRALAGQAPLVLIEIPFRSASGARSVAVVWFCEISPGVWTPAASGRSGQHLPFDSLL